MKDQALYRKELIEALGKDEKLLDQLLMAKAYMENMQIMNSIVAEMKEIPQLPSEKPNDVQALERVEFPEQGGVLTYMSNHEGIPYKGFPIAELVDRIDLIKKVIRGLLSGFYHQLKNRNKFILLTLIPSAWIFKDLLYANVFTFSRLVERFRLKPIRYSQAIRELHRAFSVQGTDEFTGKFRDLLCMFLELDNAYRFRAQDLIEEIRKDEVKKNPRKELKRVIDIATTRETTQEIKDTWKLLNYVVSYYLPFDRKLTKLISSVLLEVNVEELKLTSEDKHYCNPRKDYVFGFQKAEKLKLESDALIFNKRPEPSLQV